MNNPALEIEEIDATNLEVFANPSDLRQDVHTLVDYARSHEIKRGHRTNLIPRGHQERLAKLMSAPGSVGQFDEEGSSPWIEHVDAVCLALKFIEYDTEGSYAGYSSTEPSFPDNYITLDEQRYEQFLELPLAAQEEAILGVHLGHKVLAWNEFFSPGPLSLLDRFDSWGSATGVAPTIPFARVRRHLLELLARCPSGVWLSTASLVEHLRRHDPWFLIPKEIPAASRDSGPGKGRYGNFIERKRGDWGNRKPIPNSDPDGFAKVEGRYVERFLEGVPLVLGYTEVAYLKRSRETDLEPSRGLLPAFRVTERLRRVMRKEVPAPKVTVLPNFEVHVESLFFPAQTETQLRPLSDIVSRGIVTVFKLSKARVAATLAAHPAEKPIDRLEALCGHPLPDNVKQELNDWAGHSEKFVLYEGFGVLEGRREAAGADGFVVEAISPDLALVRQEEQLYQHLEVTEQVPIRIRHADKGLAVPAGVRSRLAPSAPVHKLSAKQAVKLKRSTQTTLWFPDAEAHDAFAKLLLDAKCVVPLDRRALTVSYAKKAEPLVQECLKKFKQDHVVAVEDIEL
jgi:hypothetical protein